MMEDPGAEGGRPRGDRPPAGGPLRPRHKFEDGGGSGSEIAGVGLQFAVSIILFLFVGQWLDQKLGTAPWMLILGVFGGAAAGFYSMYRKLMAIQHREDEARRARRARQEEERGQ
jgi:hypothetical protein